LLAPAALESSLELLLQPAATAAKTKEKTKPV
jgi:hypothetical protein